MQSDPSIPTDLVGSGAEPPAVGGTPLPPDDPDAWRAGDAAEAVDGEPGTDDPWAWAHEEPDRSEPMLDPANVAALVVVHNAEGWLPRTLQSLSRLDPRPGLTLAVDTGSTDRTPELLDQAAHGGLVDRVVRLPAETSFAEAVNRARDEVRTADGSALDTPDGWLWLLHDDCEPTRSALGQLLIVAAASPSPDVVVPALLRPRRRNYPDQLQEVGQTVSLTGSRLTGTDPGEIDQHQLESDDVLGGASAGLLVRTEIFDRVGGLDPRLQHREGVDLAWRARDTGARVVTAPRATIHHRQAGLAGSREGVSDPDPESTDRLSGMRLVAARSPHPRLAMVGLVLVGLLRGVGLVIGRAPGRALAEWRATVRLVRSRSVVRELAGERDGSRDAATEALRPHFLGTLVGGIGAAAASIGSRVIDWRASDTSLDELTGDDFAGAPTRVSIWRPSMVWALLTVLGVVAAVRLIAGDIVSTHLLPSPSFSGVWDAWWRPTPGIAGAPAPWLGFAAVGSTLAVGHPGLWIWLVLALAVVITARGASALLRELAEAPGWLIVALASVWALLLPWLGIVQRGDVGVLAIVTTAPWMALALWRWAASDLSGAAAWRAPAAVGLLGLLWVSSQPVSWLLIAGAVALVLLVRPSTWRAALPALGAPLVFVAGWIPRLAQAPARLLTTPDPLAASDAARGGPLALLGLVSRVPALPTWLVLAVGIALWLGLLALLVTGARAAGRLDLLTGALGAAALLLGVFLPRIPVSIDGRGLRVNAAAFIAVGLGILLALGYRLVVVRAVEQVDPAGDADAVVPALARRAGTRATVALAGVLSLVIATGWVVVGDRPARSAPSVLPTWVTQLQESNRAGRTLLVDLTDSPVTWQLSDATHPQWGSGEYGGVLSGQAGKDLRDLVVSIASGRPVDSLATRLADAGVVAVWVRGDNGVLSGVPGLQSTPEDSTTTVYAVTGLVSRLRLVQNGTSTPIGDATVAAAPGDCTLVLAEPTDSRWRLRVGGISLPRADAGGGWQQRFTVPAGVQGGVQWGMAPAVGSAVVQILVLVVLLVLVAPVAAPSGASPKRAALSASPRRGVSGG
ncbi:MAG TPA: glycosyltransferase family 2 protein [Propionibacteriaceae bacterium]|nr:glycosyltransferase family 2 protein [Propionibacteriaceae bacterium]